MSLENLEIKYNLVFFDIEVIVVGICSVFGDIFCDIFVNYIEDIIGLFIFKKFIECLININFFYIILYIVFYGSID